MAGITGHRTTQDLHALAHVHPATGAVCQRDNPVDIRKVRKSIGKDVAAKTVGDGTRDRGGAINARENGDVVARRHLTVGSHDAHERGGRGHGRHRTNVGTERVVAGEGSVLFTDAEIVQMDVLTGPDLARREADDLVVAPHRRSHRQCPRRDLVAGRHQPADGDPLGLDQRARHQLTTCDHDIVSRVQSKDQRNFLQHCSSSHYRNCRGSHRLIDGR